MAPRQRRRRPRPLLLALQSQTFSESSGAGRDYLAEVCRDWEAAAQGAQTRVVILRTGIVLAKEVGVAGGGRREGTAGWTVGGMSQKCSEGKPGQLGNQDRRPAG